MQSIRLSNVCENRYIMYKQFLSPDFHGFFASEPTVDISRLNKGHMVSVRLLDLEGDHNSWKSRMPSCHEVRRMLSLPTQHHLQDARGLCCLCPGRFGNAGNLKPRGPLEVMPSLTRWPALPGLIGAFNMDDHTLPQSLKEVGGLCSVCDGADFLIRS